MGLRFRRSISIIPGVRVNLGSKSMGVSVGNKYSGISYNTRTGTRTRLSAPGTGLSYTKKIGGGTKANNQSQVSTLVSTHQKNKWVAFWLCVCFGFFGAHKFYEGKTKTGLVYLCTMGFFGMGWMLDCILLLFKPTHYYIH